MEKRKCGTNIKTKMCISQWYVYTKYLCLVYNWDAPDYSQLNEEIVSLLLQGISENKKTLIQLASCSRKFKQDLIQSLVQHNKKLNLETAVDGQLDCFEWLKQLDFVEYVEGFYRLDDVARGVFRESLYHDDQNLFEQTHQYLASYFHKSAKDKADDSNPREQYDNSEWRQDIFKYLYHSLYSDSDNCQEELISYLFTSRYFNQDEIVQKSVVLILEENSQQRLLKEKNHKFIDNILPVILSGQSLLDVEKIDYESLNIEKSQIDDALKKCFEYISNLTGLAKFLALFYKSKRSHNDQKLNLLNQAYQEAESISNNYDQDFSSDLFLWTLGNEYYSLSQYEEAIASYDKAIEIKPDSHEAWNNRGIALGNLGRNEEAIASFDQAIEIKPDYVDAWNNRGIALGKLGRYEEAIASYNKAIEIKPDYHQALYNRGNALHNLGRYEEAIASYNKAIEIKPDYHQALYNRGNALHNLGRYEEAIASYNKALQIKSDYYQAWNNQGTAFFLLEQYEKAIESYDEALEIRPNKPNIFYNKACCYGLQNEIDLALENLKKAINLDDKYREMAKTDSDFDNIRQDTRFIELLK
jgi:tetratricopeptide (TPR) repeat protein